MHKGLEQFSDCLSSCNLQQSQGPRLITRAGNYGAGRTAPSPRHRAGTSASLATASSRPAPWRRTAALEPATEPEERPGRSYSRLTRDSVMLRVLSRPASSRRAAASPVPSAGSPGEPIFRRCLWSHRGRCLRRGGRSRAALGTAERRFPAGGRSRARVPWRRGRRAAGSALPSVPAPSCRAGAAGRRSPPAAPADGTGRH